MVRLLLLIAVWAGFPGAGHGAQESSPWDRTWLSLSVEYAAGQSLHQGHVMDPGELLKLSSAFHVVDQVKETPRPEGPLLQGQPVSLLLNFGPTDRHTLRIAGRNQLHHKDWGRITIAPKFFRAVEAWLSLQEEAPIRLGVENPFPPRRVEELRAFQAIAGRRWMRARLDAPGGELKVHSPEPLDGLWQSWDRLYLPSSKIAGSAWGYALTVEPLAGEEFRLELLDSSRVPVRPLHSALVRHDRLGLVWVADSLRENWMDLVQAGNLIVPFRDPVEAKRSAEAWKQARANFLAAQPGHIWFRTSNRLQDSGWRQELWAIPGEDLDPTWAKTWFAADPVVSTDPAVWPFTQNQADEAWEAYLESGFALSWLGSDGTRLQVVQAAEKPGASAAGRLWCLPYATLPPGPSPWKALSAWLETKK